MTGEWWVEGDQAAADAELAELMKDPEFSAAYRFYSDRAVRLVRAGYPARWLGQ